MHLKKTLPLLLAAAAFIISPVRADDLADKGREIFNKNQKAVVTVQIVVKMKMSMPGMGGQEEESKDDVTGTVVDPSGLTVLALSSIDPNNLLANMLSGMGDEDSRIKIDTELSDVKFLLDDGTESPAEVVLRDKDLDLAFIRPKTKPATPMTAVDLTKTSTAKVLDQVIALNRLGNAAGRAYSASVERISAIVQKPRTFYIPGGELTTTTLGSPVFSIDGNILGICVVRSVSSKGAKGGGLGLMMSPTSMGMVPIIIPADDVLKAAKQAPSAKTEEAKK